MIKNDIWNSRGQLTARAQFAKAAMIGILSQNWNDKMGWGPPDYTCNAVAKEAIEYADALILELSKEVK